MYFISNLNFSFITHTVFVYGTLKRGYENHARIMKSATFIDIAFTPSRFNLYDFGGFPAVVRSNPGYSIKGELYQVDDEILAKMDSLEGHPHWYKRSQEVVRYSVGYSVAWIYIMPQTKTIDNPTIGNGIKEW